MSEFLQRFHDVSSLGCLAARRGVVDVIVVLLLLLLLLAILTGLLAILTWLLAILLRLLAILQRLLTILSWLLHVHRRAIVVARRVVLLQALLGVHKLRLRVVPVVSRWMLIHVGLRRFSDTAVARFFKKRLLVTLRATAADFFVEQAAECNDSRNYLNAEDQPGNCQPSIDGLARFQCLVKLSFDQIRVNIGQAISAVVKRVKLGKFLNIFAILRLLSREPSHHDGCDDGDDDAATAVPNRGDFVADVAADEGFVDDHHR